MTFWTRFPPLDRSWFILLFALLAPENCAIAGPAEDVTSRFFDPATVQTIRLEIKPDDLDHMQRALPERISVPGSFHWGDEIIEHVAIRYKGNSSSSPDSAFKRSFLIAFSEYKPGQRFLGLRHVALDNGIQFGSLFSERLITDVLRGVGVPASRCNYARVYLNGQYIGVYVNVERIDRSFLQRRFGSDHGFLFKVSDGGPGADLSYVGNDLTPYRKSFDLHAGSELKAYAALLQLIRTVNEPFGTEAELRRNLDVDAFLETTAVLLLAGAFDQYTGWCPHNYYLYRDPVDQRWSYIPWDLDVGFADEAFGQIPVLDGWNAAWPAPVPHRPLMERLVSNTNFLQRYRQEARVILETWFRPEVLIPKLLSLHKQIRSDLEQDPYHLRRETVPSDRGEEDILTSMETFIQKRYTLARAQLDTPGTRPPFAPMRPSLNHAEPTPGPPSNDAPTDLEAVKVSLGGAELRWRNHSQRAASYVVQRSVGPDASSFANAIGQGGNDITSATDRKVERGKTYRYRVYAVVPTPRGPRGTGVSNVITVTIP